MSAPRITAAHIGAIVDALDAWAVGWLALDRSLTAATRDATPCAGTLAAVWRTVAELGTDRTGQYLASTVHAGQLEDWGDEIAGDEPIYTHTPRPIRPALEVLKLARTLELAACGAPDYDHSEVPEMLRALIDAGIPRIAGYDSAPSHLP